MGIFDPYYFKEENTHLEQVVQWRGRVGVPIPHRYFERTRERQRVNGRWCTMVIPYTVCTIMDIIEKRITLKKGEYVVSNGRICNSVPRNCIWGKDGPFVVLNGKMTKTDTNVFVIKEVGEYKGLDANFCWLKPKQQDMFGIGGSWVDDLF